MHRSLITQITPPFLITVFRVNGRSTPSYSLFHDFTASLQLSLIRECSILRQTEGLSLSGSPLQSSFLCLFHQSSLNKSLVCLQFSNSIDQECWSAATVTGDKIITESEELLGQSTEWAMEKMPHQFIHIFFMSVWKMTIQWISTTTDDTAKKDQLLKTEIYL